MGVREEGFNKWTLNSQSQTPDSKRTRYSIRNHSL
jgi:hypothetical protein